ncbi:hypothetical protein Mkiyose1595_41500 [Mycobacterium kiyosense]|uniref:PE domain-containing protein n=1 Tax=Mycobacterium kiyosense TaxID=2871094 RepID=A0A9P3UY53_9MYCO|nr:hypothetical protein Mkiyose1413_32170 [Mycobacterium kiyosense]GLD37930.1 hypothetical protein Mkiyose1595_41500 [Mycobacterium kiyosense]
MSFVRTYPEHLAAAASNLQSLGAALNVGSAAADVPITTVVPAAVDEVSILTAMQFATHAQRFQELSAQASRIQAMLSRHWPPVGAPTPKPKRPTPHRRTDRPRGNRSHSDGGLRYVAARDQLCAYLCRARSGLAGNRGDGVEWAGR